MVERPPIIFKLAALDWSRTYVMGVINATPDSFSGPGAEDPAGADIVDIGGESTHPNTTPITTNKK